MDSRFPLLRLHEEIIQQFIRHRCLGNQTQYRAAFTRHPLPTKIPRGKKNVFFNLLRRIFRLESSNSLKFPPLVSHSLIGKTTGPNPGTDPAVKSTNRMVYLNYMQIIRSVLKSVGIF